MKPSITRCKVRQWLQASYEAVQAEKHLFDKDLPALLTDALFRLDFPDHREQAPVEERKTA